MNPSVFSVALTQEMARSLSNAYGTENWDQGIRGRPESYVIRPLVEGLNTGTVADQATEANRIIQLAAVQQLLAQFLPLHALLADESSKSLLIKLAAYRILGYTKVKLPLNTVEYWSARKSVESLIQGSDSIKLKFRDWILSQFDLSKIGYPVRLFQLPVGVVTVFMIKQYEYRKRIPVIKAEPGDYVIDGGGCWGDTALDFACSVGPNGKVFSFEFANDNLDVFWRNMELNHELASRITLVKKALWEKSGEERNYSEAGPGTSLDREGSLRAQTITIDDFVAQQQLPRVDFIKMDIERAELRALKGAAETIRRFRPKLAISLYHKESDFADIPQYLNNLRAGYEFFLDNFTIFEGETILFAQSKAR